MYILVDARIIIKLPELPKWQAFIDAHNVGIPGVVATDEALYVDIGGIRRTSIVDSIAESIRNRIIQRFDADLQEMALMDQILDDLVLEGIHDGEHEALALMLTPALQNYNWCCSDGLAYKAAGMLELSERCVCLNEELRSIGQGCSLPHEYSREFMDRGVNEGVENRITGLGLRQ